MNYAYIIMNYAYNLRVIEFFVALESAFVMKAFKKYVNFLQILYRLFLILFLFSAQ